MSDKSKGGRPVFEPTKEQRQMVEVLSGFAVTQDRICAVVGVSLPTLHKHFAEEIARGQAAVEAKLVGNLLRIASGSDGTALKAIMFALNTRFGWSQYAPAPKAPEPLGKKEEAELEAKRPPSGDWADLVH